MSDLLQAAANGDLQTVQYLLDVGPPVAVDARGHWGVTPLMEAARLGHTEIVAVLLNHGADPLAQDDGQRPTTAFFGAIRTRHSEAVREMAGRITAQQALDRGLEYAVLVGHVPTVEALLDCGANADTATSGSSRTALMEAVAARDRDLLRLLLSRGASLDRPARCTPLMLAVLLRDPSMVEWLIDAGADLEVTDAAGRTALAIAKEIGDERLVKLLAGR